MTDTHDRTHAAPEARGNWGRWGLEDQRGALNLLQPEVVLAALSAAGDGRVAALGLTLSARGTPSVPPRPGIVHTMLLDGGDYAAGARLGPNGFQFADDFIALPVHTGTHVDALSHVGCAGAMYNGFPTTAVRSNTGARKLGIEHFGGLVTRAVVLDIPGVLGTEGLPDAFTVRVDHLERALERAGTELRAGDAALIHTGWLAQYDALGPRWYETEPGIGLEAAGWLAERDVVMIGSDNWAVEAVPGPADAVMPVHLLCLVDHGIYLLEMVDLRPLIGAGVGECVLIMAPLPIRGGLGSPVNPLAVF
jgi:kynurenine formamidase